MYAVFLICIEGIVREKKQNCTNFCSVTSLSSETHHVQVCALLKPESYDDSILAAAER